MATCFASLLLTATALAKPTPAQSRPNVLVILADDLGYNDLGVFGSEIHTPNIDSLAANGTILTNYYSAPLCAPTRAELLSGTDHHRAGEGIMSQSVEGAPGYEGYLNHRVVSLATRLKSVGYHTYMAGKWHLGDEDDQAPRARGFERSFVLLPGAGDHFSMKSANGMTAKYREDGKLVSSLPANFYSTITYTDKMLNYLRSNEKDGKPFFAYLAYTAPHWPIQAPADDIAKQKGRYDDGYEVLRQKRFAAWKARGFASADAELPNLPPNYRPWASLSETEKAQSSRIMEVYAAMVERMDSEIGRVVQYLEESGQLDNTLIIFQSDNGAEGTEIGKQIDGPNGLASIGLPGSWNMTGRGWAEASSAPFFMQKYWATEGGIHVPAIISGPQFGIPKGTRSDAVLVAYDVAPTVLQLAGASTAAPKGRTDVLPITGRSFLSTLRGDGSARRGANDLIGWEHSGNAAVRMGDWKLVWVGWGPLEFGAPHGGPSPSPDSGGPPTGGEAGMPGSPGETRGHGPDAGGFGPEDAGRRGGFSLPPVTRESLEAGAPAGTPVGKGGPWKLFNLRSDPAELYDQSKAQPEIYRQMLVAWDRYAAENGVIVKQGE